MRQATLLLIKPDAMRRGVWLDVERMVKASGLTIMLKQSYEPNAPRELIESHYREHVGRSYFEDLVNFMLSGPIIALRIEGEDAIHRLRVLIGDKDFTKAAAGTIRRELGFAGATPQETVVHGSDSEESAQHELSIWFEKDWNENPLAEQLKTGHG